MQFDTPTIAHMSIGSVLHLEINNPVEEPSSHEGCPDQVDDCED